MTLDEFWQYIEDARNSCAKLKDAPSYLSHRLSQLPERDIIDFSSHFHDSFDRADDASLWAAAIVILRGCSDDGFDYFIGWLIAQGRKVFEAALVNPDSLADLESFEGGSATAQLESILSVDVDAYLMRTGSDDFEILRMRPRSGTKNSDFLGLSEDRMKELFPKLAARFSRQRDGMA